MVGATSDGVEELVAERREGRPLHMVKQALKSQGELINDLCSTYELSFL